MRRYETFVIIDPDISQEQREPVVARVQELIAQQKGFLAFEDVWGERKLAYEIKKKERGYYIRFDYCGQSELVNEIERFFRIDDRALKYMTVVLDKDVDLEKVKEEKAAAERRRQPEPVPAPQEAAETAATAAANPPAVEVATAQAAEPAAPVEEAAAPVEEPAAPVEEPAAPVEEPAAPVKKAANPTEAVAAPVEEAAAPAQEATPVAETLESAEKTNPDEKKEETS